MRGRHVRLYFLLSGLHASQPSRVVYNILYNYVYIIIDSFLYHPAYLHFAEEIRELTR